MSRPSPILLEDVGIKLREHHLVVAAGHPLSKAAVGQPRVDVA